MLFLETSGYKYSKKRCKSIVEWFFSKHLPNHKVFITVNHRGLYREGVYGWCTVEDCNYRPRDFLIEIHNSLSLENYTKTMIHELWHVYQHVKGSLKDKYQKRLWRGIDYTDTDYENQPWEIQAHQMEDILYIEYLTETGQIV
jgi:hypothetical protein